MIIIACFHYICNNINYECTSSQIIFDVSAYRAILHVYFIKGESGSNAMKGPFGSPDDAIKDFKKKFQDKTGNKWENRDSFTPKTKKYTMIEMSLEDEDETDAPAPVCSRAQLSFLHAPRSLRKKVGELDISCV